MASKNLVILIGHLGKDPDSRFMPNGDQVVNVNLATTDTWKDKSTGDKKEATEWHRLVFYRKLAEIAGQYLKKGSQIYLEGALKTRKWQDKDGIDRYTTEIIVNELKMLGGRPAGTEQAGSPAPRQASGGTPDRAPASSNFNDFDDDIPFGAQAIEADMIFRRAQPHRSPRHA